MSKTDNLPLANDDIRHRIYEVRGVKVMLDSDLAQMYEVETKVLNQSVKRNIERFPPDFMFQLTKQEWEFLRCQIGTLDDSLRFQNGMLDDDEEVLRSQIVTANSADNQEETFLRSQIVTIKNGRGKHKKYFPYVFTEQGVAMLSGVLRSERAVKVNIQIMRAFVAVRQALPRLATREDIEDLKSRVQALEGSVSSLAADNLDLHAEIGSIYHALDQMQQQPSDPLPPIGYQATLERQKKK